MTPEQKAAYVIAQSACMIAELSAMQAECAAMIKSGAVGNLPYNYNDFMSLIEKYGLHSNGVISLFHDV